MADADAVPKLISFTLALQTQISVLQNTVNNWELLKEFLVPLY